MKYNNAKISDKIEQYYESGNITISQFMYPAEIVEVNNMLKNVENSIWGGYENAERKIIFIGSEEPKYEEFISAIRITSNEFLSHRSVLGTLVSLGVKREMIGDILINYKNCDIIVINSVKEFLLNNLVKIGKEKVIVKEITLDEIKEPKDTSKEFETSVKSLRVDSVISAGFGMPRNASNDFVKNEGAKVNYVLTNSPMHPINEGDIISVRGKGRIIVKEVKGKTKSDRIRITILKK